ncbi:HAMP domain-containing protein [Salinibacter ruber]|uniref:hypothetical protein n=1 Tax=Salinibacter ruber TaxID=146919 RepID=UPI002169F88D|nr:hypothetical protein [Salinibacter ruber]MCS4139588.1 HAMP domain-containing protein [Salinibacter ruber]
MFELLLNHLPTIISAVSGLLGAGLFAGAAKLWRTYHKQKRKDAAQEQDLEEEITANRKDRISALQVRVSDLESSFEKERKARVEAEIEARQHRAVVQALEVKIDTLISMVRSLRVEADMEPLSDKEEARLRATPEFSNLDSNAHDASSQT